jgi:hypothetical protein
VKKEEKNKGWNSGKRGSKTEVFREENREKKGARVRRKRELKTEVLRAENREKKEARVRGKRGF